jgi:spore coat polysaccharide biosynthesis protein SpsF
MSSSRLPGKVLQNLEDRPLLAYPIERLRNSGSIGALVVATSIDRSDDPIEEYCRTRRVACFRGDLDNVARRTLDAARSVDAEWFFRANADSPFLAVELYDSAIRQSDNADLVTNVFPRVLPPGASVELIRTEALAACIDEFTPSDAEHVTQFFYRNPERCRIARLDGGSFTFRDELRLVVDDATDQERVRSVLERMSRPHWQYGLQEVMDLMAEVSVQ